ncbi:MAG TPA: hypothetical protein DCE56_17570 [Cyanobacteria bacterium UBA8553]|nr:hypothetical protein [Cyanobacteria bacterium UBA8553]HAJ64632.1 hypothetical protein [Cyanobacteria bacterium UBA8543]
MSSARLRQVERNLTRLRQQLAGKVGFRVITAVTPVKAFSAGGNLSTRTALLKIIFTNCYAEGHGGVDTV